MCGTAGQLGGGDARAGPMIAALTPRGPDGIRVEDAAGAALAHARLSIIDLAGGWQPLHAAGAAVVGNGELYHYVAPARDFQPERTPTTRPGHHALPAHPRPRGTAARPPPR